MSLSDEERRELDQLEKGLAAEDPGLAKRLAPEFNEPGSASRPGLAITVVALGLITVIGGIGAKLVLVGVLGLLLMGCGSYWLILTLYPAKPPRPPSDHQPGSGYL